MRSLELKWRFWQAFPSEVLLFMSPSGFSDHLGWAFNACAEFIRKNTNGAAIIEEHSFKETSETGLTVLDNLL